MTAMEVTHHPGGAAVAVCGDRVLRSEPGEPTTAAQYASAHEARKVYEITAEQYRHGGGHAETVSV